MKTNRLTPRRTVCTLCAALALPAMAALFGANPIAQAAPPAGLPPGPPANACNDKASVSPIPADFDGYLVYMSNGEIDLNDLHRDGDLSFFTDLMGWTPAEIEDFRQDRLDRIETKFGIPDPDNNPDVVVQFGTADTEDRQYRAYTVGGHAVPADGWTVNEGALLVVVTNPAGIDLGGEWAGFHAPFGTTFSGGMYNIQVTDGCGNPTGEEIVIKFGSNNPIVVGGLAGFTFHFFCEVESFDFPGAAPGLPAHGLAEGLSDAMPIPGTSLVKLNTRNVITFSHDPSLGADFDGY